MFFSLFPFLFVSSTIVVQYLPSSEIFVFWWKFFMQIHIRLRWLLLLPLLICVENVFSTFSTEFQPTEIKIRSFYRKMQSKISSQMAYK